MPNLTQNQLQKITTDIFEAGGVPSDEAAIIGELLIASNLAGHDSHGVIRIPQYIGLIESGLIQPGAPLEIDVRIGLRMVRSSTAIGGSGMSSHRKRSARDRESKVKHYQTISVYNCNHIGRIGSYPMMAADSRFGRHHNGECRRRSLYDAPFGGSDGVAWQQIPYRNNHTDARGTPNSTRHHK